MKADAEAQKEIKQEELQKNFKTAIEVPVSMANNIVELTNIIRFVDKSGCETSSSDVKQANISKKIDELETELKCDK